MKRKTVIVLLLLSTLAALLTACGQNFSGGRTADDDSYALDIVCMNGTDRHTLELKAGDVLEIRFGTEKGSLLLEIKAPDGTLLYSGNGKSATDFTLNIAEGGSYSVRVEARRAQGTIDIQRKEVS